MRFRTINLVLIMKERAIEKGTSMQDDVAVALIPDSISLPIINRYAEQNNYQSRIGECRFINQQIYADCGSDNNVNGR